MKTPNIYFDGKVLPLRTACVLANVDQNLVFKRTRQKNISAQAAFNYYVVTRTSTVEKVGAHKIDIRPYRK